MIRTHLITGSLGVGKTTAIMNLLAQRPEGESWAVLVNEFGEVGIDGALLNQTSGPSVHIREVPGGCLCCTAGVPFQVGLSALIRQAKPDVLLIEPSGLGHPKQILDTLRGKWFKPVLTLAASLCLLDPRRLADPRFLQHQTFLDQLAIADVLVANRLDQCQPDDLARLAQFVDHLNPRPSLVQTQFGQLSPEHLLAPCLTRPIAMAFSPLHTRTVGVQSSVEKDPSAYDSLPPLLTLKPGEPWRALQNQGLAMNAKGWLVQPEVILPLFELLAWANALASERMKAIVHTDDGWMSLNWASGVLTVRQSQALDYSRLEIVDQQLSQQDSQELEWLLDRAAESAIPLAGFDLAMTR